MTEDYYTLLGVEPQASEEAILEAYREKAAEHHPDVSEEADAERTFQRLNQAKDVLTDTERRREYDRLGHDQFVDQSEPRGSANGSPVDVQRDPDSQWQENPRPQPIERLFRQFFGSMRGWPSTAGGYRSRPRGTTAHDPFTVDLGAQSLEGEPMGGPANPSGRSRQGTGDSPPRKECPKCQGRGRFVHVIDTSRGKTRRIEPCERCHGSGDVAE